MAVKQSGSLVARLCAATYLIPIFMFPSASQAVWEIEPFIETRAAYSDNVNFEEDEDSDFVTQINPGVSIRKDEGRLRVTLDYLLQNFYSFDDSDLSSDHNLDAFSSWEAIRDHFFIDVNASITNVLIDSSSTISANNLNDTGNTTDETTVGIEPRWVQRFGGFALGELAYLYEIERFDEETDDDGIPGDIDDSDRQRFLATLQNQEESDRLDWGLRHQNEKVDFSDSETVKFKRSQLDLGYALSNYLEVVGAYGYESNNFDIDPSIADEDDTFWDAGFIVGLGEFTSLEVRRGERFFGNTWFGEANISGAKLSFNAQYEEDIQLESAQTVTRDFLDSPTEIENDVNADVAADRNSVFETKRWDVTGAYQLGRSTFVINAFNEDLTFLDTLDTENIDSIAFNWIWQLTGVSTVDVLLQWQDDENVDAGIETNSDFFDLEISYIRAISPKTDFDVGYTYNEGDSDNAGEDFEANTIDVGLVHRF